MGGPRCALISWHVDGPVDDAIQVPAERGGKDWVRAASGDRDVLQRQGREGHAFDPLGSGIDGIVSPFLEYLRLVDIYYSATSPGCDTGKAPELHERDPRSAGNLVIAARYADQCESVSLHHLLDTRAGL